MELLPKIKSWNSTIFKTNSAMNSPKSDIKISEKSYKTSTTWMQDFITGTKMLRTIEWNSPEKQFLGPLIATIGIRAKRSLDKFRMENGASGKL